MSLQNLNKVENEDAPFSLWKTKLKVRYLDDIEKGQSNDNNQISTDSGEYIEIKKTNKSPSLVKLNVPKEEEDNEQHSSTGSENRSPSFSTGSVLKKTRIPASPSSPAIIARSPCDSCGNHYIPIMSPLPTSPLAKSQNNLDVLVESAAARQALLTVPVPTMSIHHVDSEYSIAPHSIQISRRPSVMLQEILSPRRGSMFAAFKKNGQPPLRKPRNSGYSSIAVTANGSTATMDQAGGPKSAQAKMFKEKNRRVGNDSISSALSALYCKLLVLLGLCLPITEVISDQIPTYVYQGFYVYLYAGSIMFVVFLYATTIRNRTLFNALKDYHEKNNNIHLKHKVTRFGSFYLRVGAIAFAIGTMVYSGLEFGQFFELNGQPGCRNIFIAITPICRMVLCIFQVQFIFLNTTYIDMARHKVTSRFGLMHMVGTNLCEWLYVLVEETKHEIFHIGHLDGDNLNDPVLHGGAHGGIDWTAVNATLTAPHHHSALVTTAPTVVNSKNTIASDVLQIFANVTVTAVNKTIPSALPGGGCSRINIMGALVQEVSPFLFPCTIEYSLICAVILFEMWKTVKSIPDIDKTRKHSLKPTAQKPAHHFSVDCSQSHKGLFFGILIIVITIISMIMYFVLYAQPGYEFIATKEVTLWETIMYFSCGAAIVVGMILMRDLKYVKDSSDEHHSMELDNLLLIVAQTGVYLYSMFSILGSYFSEWDTVPDRVEGIIAESFALAQTSLQTMFILHSSHRRCKGAKQQRRKPGREIITFLLVANIALWFINTLIKGRAVFRETHLEFFGVWGWTIITHVSMPLAIFYRFHSTICLVEVWKFTYKVKAH